MKMGKKMLSSTIQFVFVLIVLTAAFVFAMFQGGQVSWTIFYILLPFVLYALLLFFYPMSDIKVSREIRTPNVQSGGKLIVSLSISRSSFFPLLYTVVTDKWAGSGQIALTDNRLKRLFVFGLRKEIAWEYEIEHIPRGEHVLEGIEVEVSDFFGWIRKKKRFPIRHTVLVFPKMRTIQFAPADTQYDRGAIASPMNKVKDTTLVTGVRKYQSGDRMSWIHWKSFARTQTLMTKEFEDRRTQEMLIIMDSRETIVFEEIVDCTASLINEANKSKSSLALMTTGEEISYFPFIQTDAQLQKALVHLAKIQPIESSMKPVGNKGNVNYGGRSTLIVTGSPDWTFLHSIAQNVKSNESLVCYVVIGRGKDPSQRVMNDIQVAKRKGIHVHLLEIDQFSEVFQFIR